MDLDHRRRGDRRLLVRHIVGALSTDDGYNLTIARGFGRSHSANYYRYFGAAEAYLTGTRVCWRTWPRSAPTASDDCPPCGRDATWLIISRCILPWIGRRVAANRVAMLDRGGDVPRRVAAVQQRPAARTTDRVRRGRGGWILVENAIGTRRKLWPAWPSRSSSRCSP